MMKYLKRARLSRDIGFAVKRARHRRGLTQHQLAEQSGIWQETISRIENGRMQANIDTLLAICRALEVDILFVEREELPNLTAAEFFTNAPNKK